MSSWPFPRQSLVFTCLQYKSFENTVGKREIARNEQFRLFPQCFLSFWRTFCHFQKLLNCHLQTLSVWKSLKSAIWKRVNSLQHNPDFWRPQGKKLLKTFREKEKMLVTSIFSFSQNVFCPFWNHTCHTSRIVRDSPGFWYFVPASRKLWNCPGNLKNKVNKFFKTNWMWKVCYKQLP